MSTKFNLNIDHEEPCIYTITCLTTGDFYVGSAWKPWTRFFQHMGELRRNVHNNPILQGAYNKYGKDDFEYTVIRHFHPKEISRNGLYTCEQMYINQLQPKYNIAKIVKMPPAFVDCAPSPRRREWSVADPNGNTYHVTNLRKFCREHNLCRPNMWYIAQGKMSHYKGWKCSYTDGSTPTFVNKAEKCYRVTFPDGTIEEVLNLSKFCRKHNLSVSNLSAVLCGLRKHYKRFKVERINQ